MNRLAVFALVAGSALFAGCGQRLLDFYNDHDDAGVQDMHVSSDLRGADLNGVDQGEPDAGSADLGPSDLAVPDLSMPGDMTVPIDMTSADLQPACLALKLPGLGSIVTAGPGTPDFYTPAGALTVEAWVYQTSQAASAVLVAHTGDVASGSLGYYLSTDATGHLVFSYSADHSAYTTVTSTATVPMNAWTHVAGELVLGSAPIVIDTLTLWIDGASSGTSIVTGAATTAIMQPLSVGSFTSAASNAPTSFIGYVHDVRVSDVARYTAAFTPAPTLASDGDTIALFHFKDAIGSTSLADSSTHDQNGVPASGAAIATPPVCQ